MSPVAAMKRFPVVVAVAVLFLNGACRDRLRTQTSMEISVEQEKAIRILRDTYAAFNRGDIAAAVAQLDPQIDWTEPPEFPGGRSYHGRDEVAGYLTQSRANWAEGSRAGAIHPCRKPHSGVCPRTFQGSGQHRVAGSSARRRLHLSAGQTGKHAGVRRPERGIALGGDREGWNTGVISDLQSEVSCRFCSPPHHPFTLEV